MTHVYHQYVVRSEKRDALIAHLEKRGIGSQILYPVPIHLQPAYKGRIPNIVTLEHTERLAHQIMTLPVYPELSQTEVERVIEEVQAWQAWERH